MGSVQPCGHDPRRGKKRTRRKKSRVADWTRKRCSIGKGGGGKRIIIKAMTRWREATDATSPIGVAEAVR